MEATGGPLATVSKSSAARLEWMLCGATCDGSSLISPFAGVVTSDGYAEVVLRYAAKELLGLTVTDSDTSASATGSGGGPTVIGSSGATASSGSGAGYGDAAAAASTGSLSGMTALLVREEGGRNADLRDVFIRLHDPSTGITIPVPALRATLAYGFRNIQTVLNRIKKGRSGTGFGTGTGTGVSYVEIMACPSGCANGGGQVKPTGTAASASGDAPSSSSSAGPSSGGPVTDAGPVPSPSLSSSSSSATPVNPLVAASQAAKRRVAVVTGMLSTPVVLGEQWRGDLIASIAQWAQAPFLVPAPIGTGTAANGSEDVAMRGTSTVIGANSLDASVILDPRLTRTRYHHIPKLAGTASTMKW